MELFICHYCGSEKPSKKSVSSHQAFCKRNPNRSNHDHSKAGIEGNKKSRISRKSNHIKMVQEEIERYNVSPSICEWCKAYISFPKRRNRFCSHSCRAKVINTERVVEYSEEGLNKLRFLQQRPDKIKVILHRRICKVCNSKFWTEKEAKCCSEECRNLIYSKTAKNNPLMGGNKNNKAYGWYESIFAGKVWLESSWEYNVAKSLDDNNIAWIRPKPLSYGNKKYYPDFYLIDYNIYLDPKNPYLQVMDADKIQMVEKTHSVKVLVLNKDELDWSEIQKKC